MFYKLNLVYMTCYYLELYIFESMLFLPVRTKISTTVLQ